MVWFNVLEVIFGVNMAASKYIFLSVNLLSDMVVGIGIVRMFSINVLIN